MLSRGSCRLKILIHFESISGGPDKIIFLVRFYFFIKGNRSILHLFCLSGLCCALFLIHDEYSIGLNVEFPIRSSS